MILYIYIHIIAMICRAMADICEDAWRPMSCWHSFTRAENAAIPAEELPPEDLNEAAQPEVVTEDDPGVGDNPPIDQGSFPRPSKNLVAVFMGVLSVGMAGMAATAHSMCGSIDLTMHGGEVEIMKRLVPFGVSLGCFEGALDSCILQFNGTVIDSSGKQSYLETWQNQGFPPINCRDLSAELWVSGFPQNCEGAWSDFGPCSTSCGGGTRSRHFQIMRPAQNGGAACHEMNQLKTEKCNDQPCPVDCVLLDWQPDVSGCSKLCGNGTVKETRGVQHDASHGGDCPDPASDQRERWVPCNVDPCPVALVEGFQSTLVATAQTVQSIREALAASGALELHNHLQFNCGGGISEDLAEAAAACVENNQLFTKTKEMSLVLEQVQDDCGMIFPFFRELVNSLKLDLPALFKDACSGSADHEELTFSFLDKHINRLLEQIEVCRTHSKTLKAKNEELISSRIGYSQDAERRSGKLVSELKTLDLEEPSLKSELLSRAGAVEETKQILETKKEDLKRSGRQLEDLKQQRLHGLSIDKAAADDATSKAGEARQHAENLESSLKGKHHSENLERLQDAKNEAKDLEDQAQQKTADYNAKIKEYNQARRDSLFHPFSSFSCIFCMYTSHVFRLRYHLVSLMRKEKGIAEHSPLNNAQEVDMIKSRTRWN